jgi:ribonuclease P protein component
MRATFRPYERLRLRSEIQRVFDHGNRVRGRLMTLVVAPNGLPISRLGIVASRKLGGAVRRNRAKRLVREAFRRHKPRGGLDVVVLTRPELLEAQFATVEADFSGAVRRAGGQ